MESSFSASAAAWESFTGAHWRADQANGGTITVARTRSAFSVRDYADAIVPPLRDLGIRILVEPGRFLIGNAGVLLTRVRYIKQTGRKKFVIVDAGMNDLIRPALYQSYHEIVPVIQTPNRAGARARKQDRHRRAGVRVGRFLCARPRNVRPARRRFARDHERGRVRICDGVELQFASATGRSAGSRR